MPKKSKTQKEVRRFVWEDDDDTVVIVEGPADKQRPAANEANEPKKGN